METFDEAFRHAEQTALGFMSGHGFAVAERWVRADGPQATGGLVRYSSTGAGGVPDGWSVTLYVAPFRLELGLDVSDGRGANYSLEELYLLECGSPLGRREEDLYTAAIDRNVLARACGRLANALREAGHRFFTGDVTVWHALAEQRRIASEAADEARILAESKRALQAKDWSRVVGLLAPLRSSLRGAAAARLRYAEKRSQAT